MKLNRNLVGLFLFSFLFLSFAFGVTNAYAAPLAPMDDSDNDGVDDEFEAQNERGVNVELRTDEIKVKSILKGDGSIKDVIEIKITYNTDGLGIQITYESDYESDTESDLNVDESEAQFQIVFRKIIEFVDTDGDNIYNPSSDQMIKEVPLDSFKTPNYYNDTTVSGTTVHYFEINTTDDVFSAQFYVVEEFEKINDILITPTETKIDFIINGFTYDNSSSQLALYAKLESDSDYQEVDETEDELNDYSSGESGVETVSGKGYVGFFTWGETAEIDGKIKDVTTSVIASDDLDDNEEKIYINYPRGNLIIHDPKLGIIQTPINQILINDWVLPVILIVGAIAAVVIVVIVYKNKKR